MELLRIGGRTSMEMALLGFFLKPIKINPYDTERSRGNMDRKRLEEEIWRGQSNSTEGRMFVLHVAFFSLNPSTQYGPQSLADVIPEHRVRSSTGGGCPLHQKEIRNPKLGLKKMGLGPGR